MTYCQTCSNYYLLINRHHREPQQIASGDTINFHRWLDKYPASQGWSLLYAMRGGAQAISFVSTPDGDGHCVNVPSVTTEGWLPAEYLLEGFAVNVDGDRYQIYLAPLIVTIDQSTAPPDADVTTHAQRMISSIECELEKMAKNVLDMTDVEGTRVQREKRNELLKLRQKYLQERRKEVAQMRARSGQSTGRKIGSVFNITRPGNTRNTFGAGNSVYDTQWP